MITPRKRLRQMLDDVPIERKLMLITMGVCVVALLVASISFVTYEQNTAKRSMVSDLSLTGDTVGLNCVSGLSFGDREYVQEALDYFQVLPGVAAAAVYDDGGELFASYQRKDLTEPVAFPDQPTSGHAFGEGQLEIVREIQWGGDYMGTIYIRSDLSMLEDRLTRYALIVLAVMGVAFVIAYLLSRRLQRIISGPIFHLAETANRVGREQNFGIRAVKQGNDELGDLIMRFNDMLAQIQNRDAALQEAHDELERRVQRRTSDLHLRTLQQATVARLSQMALRRWQVDELIVGTAREVADTLKVDSCEILETPESNGAPFWSERGNAETLARGGSARIPEKVEGGVLALAMSTSDPVVVEDSRTDERFREDPMFVQDGYVSGMAVVIGGGSKNFGVLIARCKDQRQFTEHDVSFLQSIANVLGSALERKRASEELNRANQELVEASRLAGMAEVATGVIHNVGNVLNSVNVSTNHLSRMVEKSGVQGVRKLAALLDEQDERLAEFLTNDERGRRVPAYLSKLGDHLEQERKNILAEVAQLAKNVEHIKDIVATQQSYGTISGAKESLSPEEVVNDTLRLHETSLIRRDIHVERIREPVGQILADRHKTLQILLNLVRNAQQSLESRGGDGRTLVIRIGRGELGFARIEVQDNGVGISKENMKRIFTHGFTTKRDGHGFGLHNSALAAREMGGSLTAHSEGENHGAIFRLELPLVKERDSE